MIKNHKKIFTAVIILLLSLTVFLYKDSFLRTTKVSAASQSPDSVDAFEQNLKLSRGVNLGMGRRVTEEDFNLIKLVGFDSVRIPVHPFRQQGDDPPYTVDPALYERLDWVIEQGLSRELAIIIEFHDYYPLGETYPENKDKYLSFWEQTAEHYKDYPNDLFFETCNEPNTRLTIDVWNDLQNEVITLMRKTNPNRTIIVTPVNWDNIWDLQYLELPEDDRNLIASIHYYEPESFTHQGAQYVRGRNVRLAGELGANGWLGSRWTGTPRQMEAVRQDFELAAAWGKKHNRPVFMGEFGCNSDCLMEDREKWIGWVVLCAENLGITWAYWTFTRDQFAVYDAQIGNWKYPILEALLPHVNKRDPMVHGNQMFFPWDPNKAIE